MLSKRPTFNWEQMQPNQQAKYTGLHNHVGLLEPIESLGLTQLLEDPTGPQNTLYLLLINSPERKPNQTYTRYK